MSDKSDKTDKEDNMDEGRICGIHLFSGVCDESCISGDSEERDEHAERHPIPSNRTYTYIWASSDGNTKMVSCLTCGYKSPYNPQIHINVEDVD